MVRANLLSVRSAAFGLLLAGASVAADGAVGVTRNGVTWDATFEGDVASLAGSTPAWSAFDLGSSPTEFTDGDIRWVNTTAANQANSYSVASGWSGTGGARTVEIRARVPNADIVGDGQASLILGVNNVAYDFRFSSNGILYNDGNVGLGTAVSMDTSAFHIYRVTVDQSANPVINLYIDNNPTPAFTSNASWFTSGGFDSLVFGDISTGGEAGQVDVDYISWSDGVFPAAVPEPTSVAGIALIAGAAIARRRRRLA